MISKVAVTVPFGTYAVVKPKGSRHEVETVLMRPVALEVEAVESRHLRPAATVVGAPIRHIPGESVEETVYAMGSDRRLFRPIGLDHRTMGRTSLTANRVVPFFEAGNAMWDLPYELPDTVVTPHAFLKDGMWQRPDFRPLDEPGLRIVSDPDEAEAASRLARLQSRLLVVDGEIWSECPAPRLFAEDRYSAVQLAPSSGVVNWLTGHGGMSVMGFQFPLDRLEDAERCVALADREGAGLDQRYRRPRFEIHDYDAVGFDGAAASAFHMGPNLENELSRYVAGFSDEGIEAYVQIRGAVRRMRDRYEGPVPMSYPHAEDAAILHEACGRLGDEPGFDRGIGPRLGDPMPLWLKETVGQFGRRYRELETGDAPDLALGGPQA